MVTSIIENIKQYFILPLNKLVTVPFFSLVSHTIYYTFSGKPDTIYITNCVILSRWWKLWQKSIFCNMFTRSKQSKMHITENTSILFILNIFNFWCMRVKIMHLCIIWIDNWNMNDLILWTLFTKDICIVPVPRWNLIPPGTLTRRVCMATQILKPILY